MKQRNSLVARALVQAEIAGAEIEDVLTTEQIVDKYALDWGTYVVERWEGEVCYDVDYPRSKQLVRNALNEAEQQGQVRRIGRVGRYMGYEVK